MPTYVTNLDFETGQGERAVVHYTTGAQAFDIEIDKDTGRIEVIKAASAFDVGRAINPELVLAQIEGGLVQGYSSAVFEQMQSAKQLRICCGTWPVPAALGNAIYNATGLRLEGPPFTAEKLYLAMLDAGIVE